MALYYLLAALQRSRESHSERPPVGKPRDDSAVRPVLAPIGARASAKSRKA